MEAGGLFTAAVLLVVGVISIRFNLARPWRKAARVAAGLALMFLAGDLLPDHLSPHAPLPAAFWIGAMVAIAGLCLAAGRAPRKVR
jgi:Na+/phosphate symporter